MNKDILLELLGAGKEYSLDEYREYQCAEFRAEGIEQLSYQRRNPEVAVIIFEVFSDFRNNLHLAVSFNV